MRESLLIAYFVLTIMPSQQQKDLLTTPIVGIELRDGGYHRDLIYTVQFDYPLAGKNCEYILQQSLPASVYISVDQLDDLVRKKKLDAIYPGYVDIEKPTEESSDFEIFIKGSTKVSDTVTLPIHFRYHAPNDENSFIPVDLIAPAAMYIKCPIPEEQDLVERKLEIESNTIYCLDESVPAIREYIKRDINVRSSGVCNWKLVNIALQIKSSLHAEIPIGNVSAHPTVLYLTIIISWAVSLWTIFRTRHIPILINEKLDEQRLLQRKIK
ncbi:phosphatidylinositol-glycan biosynthesis class X protein [Stomoxys calcitrans]|uniref:Phosphatidylinositol-glycan biosynthesis class X protein n=1 Tax=Stomoxys calcitrans TaxID=35570 RepID=A0A1I8NNH8_STOCA|nr:phosphatidylinositol-glycan biosynthesis class X protein [Stomoxys calcitrans]